MRKFKISLFLIISTLLFSSCSNDVCTDYTSDSNFVLDSQLVDGNQETANVIILLGQSNATGISKSEYLRENDSDLYTKANDGYDNVLINYYVDGGTNYSKAFVKTRLGQGTDENNFGPEIGIADTMHNQFSNKNFYIIKYSLSGSSLAKQWLKNRERSTLYYQSIAIIKNSLDYLINSNYKINICGICWMQGETDATHLYGFGYLNNLSSLVRFYRDDLSTYSNKIRFIDAGISSYKEWLFYKSINSQKNKFSKKSEDNYYIDTIALGLTTNKEPLNNPDPMHYDSMSEIALGKAFGNTLSPFVL